MAKQDSSAVVCPRDHTGKPGTPASSRCDDSGPKLPAFAFVLATVFLEMLAFGLITPVLPSFAIELAGGSLRAGTTVLGAIGLVWATSQFLLSPTLLVLSDRFGRRPVLLWSSFGSACDGFLTALAPNIWILLVARAISGASAATNATAAAYISDTTPPARRASAFGMLGAAAGAGLMLGPAIGGLLGVSNIRAPFLCAGALNTINLLYGYFVLPESHHAHRTTIEVRALLPVLNLRVLIQRTRLVRLAIIYFLSTFAQLSLPTVLALYLEQKFGWTTKQVGVTFTVISVASIASQLVALPLLRRKLSDQALLIVALFAGVIGMMLYAVAADMRTLGLGIVLTSLWGLSVPAAQALFTNQVSHELQGRLQGALVSVGAIAGMSAPLVFSQLLAIGLDRGVLAIPFLTATGLLTISVTIALLASAAAPRAVKLANIGRTEEAQRRGEESGRES